MKSDLILPLAIALLSKQYIGTRPQSTGDLDGPDLLTLCLFWKPYAPAWNCRDTSSPGTSRHEPGTNE